LKAPIGSQKLELLDFASRNGEGGKVQRVQASAPWPTAARLLAVIAGAEPSDPLARY
jgi:hypothetical protein